MKTQPLSPRRSIARPEIVCPSRQPPFGDGRAEFLHHPQIWEGALRVSLQRPFFGVGESQFIEIVPEAESILNHPHNSIVQIIAQWGYIGLSLMIILSSAIWMRLLRIARLPGTQIIPAFFTINTMLIYSLYDGVFYFVYPVMILSFLIALCLSAGKPMTLTRKPHPSGHALSCCAPAPRQLRQTA